jgi:tetratricopeptide (TPR) repeat protein
MAAALGAVALLATASFFFVKSRRAPEVQAGTQPAGQAEPSVSPQPAAQQLNQQANQQPDQQSSAGANNQAQQQTRPQPIGEVKSPTTHNADAASNQQLQAAAKPTPATPQEQPAAGGTSAAEHQKQGTDYMNSGRYQEALREFEYVKNLDPGNKNVYYLIGSTYQRMNQLEHALEAYRQCTSGDYASVSKSAVKNLEKKVGKVNAK